MNKLDVTYHKGFDPQDVVEHFICAFNEKRLEVLNTLWSSPCTFIIKDQIKSYQKYSQAVNFSEIEKEGWKYTCLLYTSPSPRDSRVSRMPSSA